MPSLLQVCLSIICTWVRLSLDVILLNTGFHFCRRRPISMTESMKSKGLGTRNQTKRSRLAQSNTSKMSILNVIFLIYPFPFVTNVRPLHKSCRFELFNFCILLILRKIKTPGQISPGFVRFVYQLFQNALFYEYRRALSLNRVNQNAHVRHCYSR